MSRARVWAAENREKEQRIFDLQKQGTPCPSFGETHTASGALYGMDASVTADAALLIRTFHTGQATLDRKHALAFARWILETFSEDLT